MSWSQIVSIRSMKIFAGSGDKNASLYANGNHRVEVVVSIIAYDKNNQVVNLTEDEMVKNIKLVNFLNEDLSSPFKWYRFPGDFGEAVRFEGMDDNIANELDTNASTLRWYISIDTKKYDSYKIAIRCYAAGNEYTTAPENNNQNATVDYITLNILNPKKFNTSNLDIVTMPVKYYRTVAVIKGISYESVATVQNKYIGLIESSGSVFKKVKNVNDNIIIREDQQPISSSQAVNIIAVNTSSVIKEPNKKFSFHMNKNTNMAEGDYYIENIITNEFDGIPIIAIHQFPYQISNKAKNPLKVPQEFIAYDQFGNIIKILCHNNSGTSFDIEYTVI